jgi:hypothetical protein
LENDVWVCYNDKEQTGVDINNNKIVDRISKDAYLPIFENKWDQSHKVKMRLMSGLLSSNNEQDWNTGWNQKFNLERNLNEQIITNFMFLLNHFLMEEHDLNLLTLLNGTTAK